MAQQKLTLSYKIFLASLRVLFRIFSRIDHQGLARTPQDGPLIITMNHISNLDAPLVFHILRRHPINLMAKAEHKGTLIGKLVDIVDGIYVNRGEVDRGALKELLRRLNAGAAIGISPEGTRSHDKKLAEGKEGVAYLALQTNAWIFPVAAWGHERAMAEFKRFRRPKVYVRFGEPFKLVNDPTKDRRENLAAGTEHIMHAIAQLLPPEYRGFYADAIQGPPVWQEGQTMLNDTGDAATYSRPTPEAK